MVDYVIIDYNPDPIKNINIIKPDFFADLTIFLMEFIQNYRRKN